MDKLTIRIATAKANMLAAWDAQSKTTVEEGYTIDQANAAIEQALDAQREWQRLIDQRDALSDPLDEFLAYTDDGEEVNEFTANRMIGMGG